MEEREYIHVDPYKVRFMNEKEAGSFIINFVLHGWIAHQRDCKSNMVVLSKGMSQEFIVVENGV